MNGEMRSGAIKSATFLALTAAMAVCGANEASTTTFQLDRVALERIHYPTEQQVSHGWMARLSVVRAEDSAGWGSPRLSRSPTTHGSGAWRLAALGPLASRHSGPARAGAEIQLVRLRASARNPGVGSRSIDADVFEATPGGRPISDTYDFAGLDPDAFAKIKPVEMKEMPVQAAKPPNRGMTPPPRPYEVLELGANTLGYIVMTTKIFFDNLSRILKNSP